MFLRAGCGGNASDCDKYAWHTSSTVFWCPSFYCMWTAPCVLLSSVWMYVFMSFFCIEFLFVKIFHCQVAAATTLRWFLNIQVKLQICVSVGFLFKISSMDICCMMDLWRGSWILPFLLQVAENLAQLMYSVMMTGYMFRNAQYRLELQQSLTQAALPDRNYLPVSIFFKVKMAY